MIRPVTRMVRECYLNEGMIRPVTLMARECRSAENMGITALISASGLGWVEGML